MGNERNVKQLRGQLRQIVNEMLPEVLKTQTYAELRKELRADLEVISKDVKDTLTKIDERGKDVQNYIMRQVTPSPLAGEVVPETENKAAE